MRIASRTKVRRGILRTSARLLDGRQHLGTGVRLLAEAPSITPCGDPMRFDARAPVRTMQGGLLTADATVELMCLTASA